jgi:hypothetical protein
MRPRSHDVEHCQSAAEKQGTDTKTARTLKLGT